MKEGALHVEDDQFVVDLGHFLPMPRLSETVPFIPLLPGSAGEQQLVVLVVLDITPPPPGSV